MIKRLALALTLVVSATGILAGCTQKKEAEPQKKEEQRVVRVGSSGGYYPFTFMENDKLQGFEIDVWNEIGKRADLKIEFVTAAFSGLFGMLDTDKLDTISNQITMTEQRREKYLFATPYVYTGAQLVVKKGNDSIKSLEDLKGKKVGVDLGSNFEQIMREYDKNNEIEIITYQGSGAYQEVVLGRIDAMMIDKVSALATIQKQKLELQIAGDIVKPIENSFPFVNNEKNKELIEKVNKAIEEMRADGTLETISNKWVQTDITSK
jgi:putative amino-acid transport system substrate-binding protein/putative amino-acid transport system permease protein